MLPDYNRFGLSEAELTGEDGDELGYSIDRLKSGIQEQQERTRNQAKLENERPLDQGNIYGDDDAEIDLLTEGTYKNDSIIYSDIGQELTWANNVRFAYTYNGSDMLTEQLVQNVDSMGNWVTAGRTVYTWDGNNNQITAVSQYWIDSTGSWENNILIDSSVYDLKSNPVKKYSANWDPANSKWIFTVANLISYDTADRISVDESLIYDQFSQVWNNSDRKVYYYLTSGSINYLDEEYWDGYSYASNLRNYYYYDNEDFPDEVTEIFTGQWNGSYYASYSDRQFGLDVFGNKSSELYRTYVGFSWNNIDRTIWNYDYKGRLEYQIHQNYFGQFVNDQRTTYYYNQDDNAVKSVTEIWDEYYGEWNSDHQLLISYNQNNNPTEQISQEAHLTPVFTPVEKEVYLFNPDGRPVRAIYYSMSKVTGQWDLDGWILISYNDRGLLEEFVSQVWSSYLQAWINIERTIYHYNSNGDKTENIYYWWNEDAGRWEFEERNVFVYNIQGQRIRKITSDWNEADFEDSRLISYVYDVEGNLVVKTDDDLLYDSDRKTERIYDSANRIITEILYYWNQGSWIPSTRNKFTYDSIGNLHEEFLEYYDEYSFYWYSSQVQTYTYNADTLLTEIRVEEEGEGLMLVGRSTFEYDSLKLLSAITVEDFDWDVWDLKLTSKEEHFWSEIENYCGLFVYVTDSILPSCPGDNDGAITLQASGGLEPYTYIFNGGNQTSDTVFTGLSGNVYYSFTVKGSAGCILTDSIKLKDPAPISITIEKQNTYPGEAAGNATAIVSGGTSPFNYLWTSGVETETAANLEAGLYFLTVTDSRGCSNNAVAAINDLGGPTIQVKSITDVSCFGAKDGAINLEVVGVKPFTYAWSTGAQSQDLDNLAAGPYEVRVEDKNGLVSVKSISVRGPEKIVLKVVTTKTSCGGNDGTATVTVSGGDGPFTYLWSTGATGTTESNMAVGAYDFTVTDHDGCLLTRKVTISEVGAPAVVIDSVLNTGCGLMNGGVYLSVPMATDTITYLWFDGSELEDLTGVDAGSYYATVTNIAGCKTVISADVNQEDPEINPICLVTVDSITGKNLVAWDRVQTEGIAMYNIYRESSQKDVFYLAGTIPATDETLFLDATADPSIRSFRYKLTAVDNCGNESEFSVRHKTMHLTLNLGLDNSVNLIWDLYEGFEFSTYDIWRFSTLNGWELLESVSSNITSYTDFSPPIENLFYVVEVIHPTGCTTTELKAGTLNSSRSNRQSKLQEGLTSVSFEQYSGNGEVKVYPTLTSGLINIEWKEMAGHQLTLEVHDLTGALVLNRKFEHMAGTDFAGQADLSFAARGVYLLRLTGETGYSVVQIVIE